MNSTHGSEDGSTGVRSYSPSIEPSRWLATHRSHEFGLLRKRMRRFVFPMTVLFFAWYFAYVLLAAYAPEFMAIKLGNSNFNVGLLIGLSQFVTTFAITTWYVVFARRRLDPIAERIRDDIEAEDPQGENA